MTTAEIIPASLLNRSIPAYLDEDSVAGQTPAYVSRRGRLDGVLVRLDVWEEIRNDATRAIDLSESDELLDRVATGVAEATSLGELAPALGLPGVLAQLPARALPHARSDLLTASREVENTANLAGFLAHWTRGYLRGEPITDPTRPGEVLERDVAPAYYDNQVPFRLLWTRGGARRDVRTLVAVRAMHGTMARAWTFAPPMDASEVRSA